MSETLERLTAALRDRYEIDRQIGAGGMASVFLARDLKHGRPVAIKVLKPELSSSLGSDRFLREIQIVSNLNHPHIVPVHDSGEADGLLFYVMPYVVGESLQDRLERDGRISLREALDLLREIAGAVDYAHRLGVLHRDIKPANILLSEGHALLADFGIAHALAEAEDERLTGTGYVPGSAQYMSPEQAAGQRDLDERSDIYSLGCLAYELLTGRPPFQGNKQQVLVQHLTDRATPVTELVRDLPPRVDAALVEAMAKAPDDRPPSARAFVDALEGTRDVSVPPRGLPGLTGAAVAVVAVLALAAGWFLRPGAGSSEPELDPLRIAVLYFDDLSPDGSLRYLSEGLTESLIQQLGQVEPLSVVSRNGVKPYRDLNFSVDSLARILGTGHLVEGSVEQRETGLFAQVRLIEGTDGTEQGSAELSASGTDALELRELIVAEAARFLGQELGREIELVRTRSETESDEAWAEVQRAAGLVEDSDMLRWELGDVDAAAAVLQRADSLLAHAESLDSEWAEPIIRRGWVASHSARIRGSRGTRNEGLLRAGLGHANRALDLQPGDPEALELRGSLLNDLSWLNSIAADAEQSRALQARAETDLRTAVDTEPGRARAWVALADLRRVQGDFSQASLAAQRAVEADPFLINAEKEILFALTQVWLDLGQVDRALEWSDRGRQRYPAEISFTAGKLVVLAGWDEAPAQPDTAWALAGDLGAWTPSRLLASGVLARAGLPDSARAVIADVRAAGSEDPWLDYYEANARIQLGEPDRAIALLRSFLDPLPGRRSYIGNDWWWTPLRDDPEFRALVEVEG